MKSSVSAGLNLRELRAQRTREEREFYLSDFWAFARDLLGYADIQEDPHRELFDFLLQPGAYKLVLLPRGSFKSTILGVAYPLWRLAHNPNLRILLDSRKVERAKLNLDAIKYHIERNDKFRELFGNWKFIPGWRETSIVLPQRTGAYREPSILCGGIDSPVTGGHYDLIVVDDLHDETNSATELQLNRAELHYKTLDPILEPEGQTIIIGTRWHPLDTYNHIIEENKVTSKWQILQRAAILPEGELWFPERLSEEFLEEKKERLGPYLFSTQYLLEPIPDEDRRFNPAWLKYQEITVISAEGFAQLATGSKVLPVNITTSVDPAISDKKGADYTGIVTVACDPSDTWYVLSARRVRGGAQDILDEIIGELRTWQVGAIGIETVAYQKALKEFLEVRLDDEDLVVAVDELISGTGRSKRARIEGLVPKFAARKVIFRKGIGPQLEQELLLWTPAQEIKHDDLIDALSHQLTLALPASLFGQRLLGASYYDLSPEERRKIRPQEEVSERRRPSTGYGD